MSLFKKLWVLLVPMALLLAATTVPAQADPPTQPPPPVAYDVCGTTKDTFYTPDDLDPSTDLGWKDSTGKLYSPDKMNSTGGASSVTMTAMIWGSGGYMEYTYPALTFGVEPDSSCIEAADTVTTQVVQCNAGNGGTRVQFTYTNTDDTSDRSHTHPVIQVERWDHGQTDYVVPTSGAVADGAYVSITGGDTWESSTVPDEFYLPPGTYSLLLTTKEVPEHLLPNRLFIPACGEQRLPPGDPKGGPIPVPPTATIGRCRHHVVTVRLDARKASRAARFTIVINPRRGANIVKRYKVPAGSLKRVRLRHQKSGSYIFVSFDRTTIMRKLRC